MEKDVEAFDLDDPPPSWREWRSSQEEITANCRPNLESVTADGLALRDRATLTVLVGSEAGRVHSLAGDVRLGRALGCEVRLDHASVSRVHATILRDGSRFVLVDLGSRNGVTLGGQRITHAELHDGDKVQLGTSPAMRFELVNPNEELALRAVYEKSVRDGLTGLFNRRHFHDRLSGEVAFAKRQGTDVTVCMLDVDYFKQVNDQFGHGEGDRVLQGIATIVARAIRAEDLLCRYGGEEFAIVARAIPAKGSIALAERMRGLVQAARLVESDGSRRVTISVGVAMLSEVPGAKSVEALVELADQRLYAAKKAGRNRVAGPV